MPRQRKIKLIPVKWAGIPEILQRIAQSRGRMREDLFFWVAERLDLAEEVGIAIVTLSVQPRSNKRSLLGQGPGRHATVLFPFDAAKNEIIKRKLSRFDLEFDGYAKGWICSVHCDEALEKFMRIILKCFNVALVYDGGRAFLFHS